MDVSYQKALVSYREEIEGYFNPRVEKTAKCWIWVGSRSKKSGYGTVTITLSRFIRFACSAHVLSYLLYKGDAPEGLMIRHTCDNPSCVNPAHLLLGTAQENTQDAIDRGRWVKARAKLTLDQVAKMRESFAAGEVTIKELRRGFQMEASSIYRILAGRTYPEAKGPLTQFKSKKGEPKAKAQPKTTRTRITTKMAKAIREDHAGGLSQSDLRKRYDLSRAALYKILYGRSFPHAGGPILKSPKKNGPKPSLAPRTLSALKKRYATGKYTMQQLADRYEVSTATIHKAVHS